MSASNTNAYAAGTAPASASAPAHGSTTSGHTVVPGSHADGSAGAQGAQTLGDKVKGGWNVFHGAGEAIRGNANSFLDNVGEQIAGRNPASTPQTRSAGGERPAAVAANGADEIQSGVNNLRR